MRKSLPYLACLVILAVCLPASLLQARVSRFLGGVQGPSVFVAEEFGKRLYQTLMRINGGQAEVSVVSFREGMDDLRRRVLSSQGGSVRFEAGETMGLGEITGMGKKVRVLALVPGGNPAAGVMVVTEQAQAENGTGRPLVLKHNLKELPAPSGSQVTGYMKNEDTRVGWETLIAPAPVADVVAYYETALKQAGWKSIMPSRAPDSGGVFCFMRGADICCVQVKRADLDGETQVALLHKQGALK